MEKSLYEIAFKLGAMIKMSEYVNHCNEEVGWLGLAKKTNKKQYMVEDVFLVEQEITGTTTDLSADALLQVAKQVSDEQLDMIRFWGHSHVNMGVTASSVDDSTMDDIFSNCPWAIRAILNKKGEMNCDLYLYEEGIIVKDCAWFIPEMATTVKLRKSILEEIKEKVLRKTYVSTLSQRPSYQTGKNGGEGDEKKTGGNHNSGKSLASGKKYVMAQGLLVPEEETIEIGGERVRVDSPEKYDVGGVQMTIEEIIQKQNEDPSFLTKI